MHVHMLHIAEASAAFMGISGTISIVLLAIAVKAYRQTKDAAMVFLAGAFTLFALKSFLVGYSLLTGLIGHQTLELVDAVGDLGTILLIVVPVFLRRGRHA